MDRSGNVYVADSGNNRIRRIGTDGIITTLAGSGALYGPGGFSGDGGPATQAVFNYPTGVSVDASGIVYVADAQNDRIRRFATPITSSTGPAISLSALSLSFDVTKAGTSTQKLLTILNTGARALSITGITVTGSDASQFSVSPTSATIDAGKRQEFIVTFSPTSEGYKFGSLSILHNGPGSASSIALTGGGTPPTIYLPTDFDQNGRVDFDDFFTLAAAFGTKKGDPGFDAKFDLNKSGVVDFDIKIQE